MRGLFFESYSTGVFISVFDHFLIMLESSRVNWGSMPFRFDNDCNIIFLLELCEELVG